MRIQKSASLICIVVLYTFLMQGNMDPSSFALELIFLSPFYKNNREIAVETCSPEVQRLQRDHRRESCAQDLGGRGVELVRAGRVHAHQQQRSSVEQLSRR